MQRPAGLDEDLYAVLGVPATASAKELTQAMRTLAKKYHPDLHPGDADAEAFFKTISNAYETLSVPETRWEYDFYRVASEPQPRNDPGSSTSEEPTAPASSANSSLFDSINWNVENHHHVVTDIKPNVSVRVQWFAWSTAMMCIGLPIGIAACAWVILSLGPVAISLRHSFIPIISEQSMVLVMIGALFPPALMMAKLIWNFWRNLTLLLHALSERE